MGHLLRVEFTPGTRLDLVAESMVLDCGDHHILRLMGSGKIFRVDGELEKGAHTWTLLNVLVASVDNIPTVVVDGQSTVFPHYIVTLNQFGKCIELCAGAGFMSTGARAAGLEPIAGFEQNSKFEQFYLENGGTNFYCLDIHDTKCVEQAFRVGGQGAVVLSGIACQPYSRAGDKRGGDDCRAGTLPATLKFSWLIQAPVIILECTPTALTNEFVQGQIKQFAQDAGYHVSQQVLHLHRQWVGRRDRWWCVLSARPLGPIHFEDLPESKDYKIVADVMGAPCAWPETEIAALELSLYEHHKIHCCSKGLESLLLDGASPLPTALHSWGNQCYGCACGCRGAFSEKRLTERGVFAVLVALGQTIKHEGHVFPRCRHLHPSEVALLSGAKAINWGGAMRLGLAAAGQMASPLQAVWVCAHVMSQVSKFLQVPVEATPSECLAALRASIVHECQQLWPRIVPKVDSPGDDGMTWVPPNEVIVESVVKSSDMMMIEVGLCPQGVMTPVKIQVGAFVQSLVQAEAGFRDCPVEELVCCNEHGEALNDLSPLVPNCKVWIGEKESCKALVKQPDQGRIDIPIDDVEPPTESNGDFKGDKGSVTPKPPSGDMELPLDFGASLGVSDVKLDGEMMGHLGQLPQPVDPSAVERVEGWETPGDALNLLKKKGLLAIVTPQVYTHSALCGLRSQMMAKSDRLQILANQEESWGDDEVRYHLHRVATSASAMQAVLVWDPLMTTSLLKSLQGPLLEAAISNTPEVATIVTAAVVNGHWVPFVWRKEGQNVNGFSFGIPASHVLVVQNLHAWMCTQWNAPVTAFRSVDHRVPQFCGAVTIAYVEHLIWGIPMPSSMESVAAGNLVFRQQFEQTMGTVTHRPWVWGSGQSEPDPVLLGLLRQHGVSASDAVVRAEHVEASLGKEAVYKAVTSSRPWQELKWLANQKVPPYQLIKPSELQAAVDARSKNARPLGSKKQKDKGSGKGKGKQTVLAPESLRLDPGVFVVGDGKPVHQLSLGDIGPMAIGVVLATLDQALPFISQNRQVSMGGLAIVVLNVKEAPSDLPLIAEPIRFPAVCAANAEPVLVQGLMFQLGNIPVSRATSPDPVKMECIPTFVAKLVIFRDGVQDWESFAKQPVRYVQQHFQFLVPCKEDECPGSCGKWHSGSDVHIEDPLMAVWNRQWLKGNFVACTPSEATMFVFSIRVPVELELSLIAKSGTGSIVVEPRELDGRQVSKAYHVVWLQHHTCAQAQVLKQTTEGALGLARIGDRWGLRCRSEQAARVHKILKPSTEYLPSGEKMHYLIGPVPYGTVKQSIVQACKAISWEIRPLFATPAPRNVDGIMYKVQSVVAPPKQVIPLQDGEAVITRCDQSSAKISPHVPVVGSVASVQLVQQPGPKANIDGIWVNDPWAQWQPGPSRASDTSSTCTRGSVEQQVVEAVLARLPRELVEADQTMEDAGRVAALEAKVALIQEKQSEMHQVITDQANTQTGQVMQLQSQFQAQHVQLEAAVAEQGRQLQGLGGQFQAQMEKQQTQLDGMFQSQMQRLEDLLAKRSRHE